MVMLQDRLYIRPKFDRVSEPLTNMTNTNTLHDILTLTDQPLDLKHFTI